MTDVLIVGVGGQGTLLASRVLGRMAERLGYDVKLSEVHGMAQRGGSVVTHVRYGDMVCAPVIDEAGADVILAFEKLEALRWLGRLKQNGRMFINLQEISPMPVITGAEVYPADIEQRIRTAVPDAVFVDALGIAAEAGNAKAVNIVLLGVMAHHMGLDKQAFLDAIEDTVPPKFRELNLTAFEKGYTA